MDGCLCSYHWSVFDSFFLIFGIFGRELAGQDMPEGLPKDVLTVSIVDTLLCIGDFWFLCFEYSVLFFNSMEADLWNFKLFGRGRSASESRPFLLDPFLCWSHFWYIEGVQTTSSTGKSSLGDWLLLYFFFFFFFFCFSLLFLLSPSLSEEGEDCRGFIRLPRGMESSDCSVSDLGSSLLGLKVFL